MAKPEESAPHELRPAWSLPAGAAEGLALPVEWPGEVTREWAWGGSTGKGVSVCILDSGVDEEHPLVGEVQRSVVASVGPDDEVIVEDDTEGDLCGHGTACAGIIRSLAPDCELVSVRVLGAGFTGSGGVLLAGLRWAVEQGFDVVNMSLSTTKKQFAGHPPRAHRHGLLPAHGARRLGAQHAGRELSVALLVGDLGRAATRRPTRSTFYYNPDPPVEFFARGVDVEVAWTGGARIRCTGNSFATPHMSGLCALVLGKHPELTPFQLKSVLYLTSSNVGGAK